MYESSNKNCKSTKSSEMFIGKTSFERLGQETALFGLQITLEVSK
jgi:hypothetical protein